MKKFLIFIVAAAFVFASVLPAVAQDKSVTISGWATLMTFWDDDDARSKANSTAFDDTDLSWASSGATSFLDFKFKEGPVGGHIRVRPAGDVGDDIAHLYGWWEFGAGTFYVGNAPIPNEKEAALVTRGGASAYGSMSWQSRGQSLQLKFPLGNGTFWVAAIKPSTLAAGSVYSGTADTDVMIPKLEASYDIKFGSFHVYLAGGYQTYDEVNTSNDKEYDISSWFLGTYLSWAMGPFSVNANVWTFENPVEYGYSDALLGAVGNTATDAIYDVDGFGWHVAAKYVVSDKLNFAVGYGNAKYERDNDATVGTSTQGHYEDEQSMWYVNATITLFKNVLMYPEVGVKDYKDKEDPTNGVTEENDTTWYGFKWRIRF
ncbi:MAG: hypothetical protein JRH06_10245 [Deltaproteobacteria bacterium]|nr:hypothetical protein [Deltaproteobacteria bacterium]MBW2137924.1 hypothetical protein [Deltaproteobacteria bacterium]